MTQQGKRQARLRQWGGTSLTYNGDTIAAGQAASGLTGLTFNEAEQYVCRAVSGSSAETLSGLQAAAAEKLNVPGGWDSVGDELPVGGWDFTTGGTFPGLGYGTSFTGAVSRDSLIYRGPGEARTSSLGLLCEQQATNKCTNTNMKPTDTSGTTPDAAWTTHEAVALGSLPAGVLNALPPFTPGKLTAVYRSVSNAAGSITIGGVTGNTNAHNGSGWLYVVSGDFGFSIGAQSSTIATAGEWIRLDVDNATPLATDQLAATTTQASEAYWFGDQLEENTGRTSLVEVNGAAATRLGDLPFAGISLNGSAFVAVVEFEWFLEPDSGEFNRMLQVDSGAQTASTYMANILRHTTRINKVSTGDGFDIDTASGLVAGTRYKAAFGADGTTKRSGLDGAFVGEAQNTPPASYSFVRFGSGLTGEQLNGYIRQVSLHDEAATQEAVTRLSG